MPVRVVDSMRSILELSAIFSSMRLVMRSSTLSAPAPGQVPMATAMRTGMSGSLRLGMVW